MTRWGMGTVGLLVLGTIATAHAARVLEPRAILRCETIIEREGIHYMNTIIWSAPPCLRALLECQMNGEAPCADAQRRCPGSAQDIKTAELRLISRVAQSCSAVPVTTLATSLSFQGLMANCPTSKHDAFATCLAGALRSKAGQTLSQLMPAGCAYIDAGGVAGVLPAEICAQAD